MSASQALASVDRTLWQQLYVLSADDVFIASAAIFLAMLPMISFAKRPTNAGGHTAAIGDCSTRFQGTCEASRLESPCNQRSLGGSAIARLSRWVPLGRYPAKQHTLLRVKFTGSDLRDRLALARGREVRADR